MLGHRSTWLRTSHLATAMLPAQPAPPITRAYPSDLPFPDLPLAAPPSQLSCVPVNRQVTRHVRGGQELSPLGTRDYYDFAYQAPVNVPPPSRTLLPGDSLITTCTYSGVGRSNVTKFGEASYEEMVRQGLTGHVRVKSAAPNVWYVCTRTRSPGTSFFRSLRAAE